MQNFNEMLAYEYARGYFDGRTTGTENAPEYGTESEAFAYRTGYDAGVRDYCELDERV